MKRLAPLLLTLLAALPLRAQPMAETIPPAKLPGESVPVARRLVEVQKRADAGEWAEVVEEYQRLLDEEGDALAPLDPAKPEHCVAVRRLCHIRIAALPPAGLRLYRARVDDQARKWLDQGIAQRDAVLLRRVVEQAFCSRHGDRALDLLGDLAFERGDLAEAERWWRMLARPASETRAKPPELALLFPDPQADVAVVRAKLLLARLFRGDRAGAVTELKAFQTLHPRAEGRLAGREGKLADILQTALAETDSITPPADAGTWPTFAGDPSRSRTFPQAPRCRWLDAPWRVALDTARAGPASPFAPVIAGNRVVLAGARAITVYDLFTGKLLGTCDLRDDLKNGGFLPDGRAGPPEARYTVTVVGDRIYARLGARAVIDPRSLPKADAPEALEAKADSFVVCLGLVADGRGRLPCHWQVKARLLDTDPATVFEGSPLVRDGRVYIARTRCHDPLATTSIECYDAETGAPRWHQDICEAREIRDGRPRFRHHLLTSAGPNVVYCSHSGAVVAVDAVSGKRAWAARYPRRGERTADGSPSPRELAPAVYADGRVFVAPADADHVFCLDAESGRPLWESKPVEVLHLLGVARGRVIFTTGAAPRGIRAVDAVTGRDVRSWVQPDDGSSELPSSGRGLLAGDYVFWPTRHGLRVLNQDDGQPATSLFVPPDNPVQGNLAVGSGCLVVATAKELLGYVPDGHFLEQRQSESAEKLDAALPKYRLGLALADLEQYDRALAALIAAEKLASPEEKCEHSPLRECARRQRRDVLLRWADQAEKRKRWDEAATHLADAAALEGPTEWRQEVRVRQAMLWENAGQPARAIEAWQSLLADNRLRRLCSAQATQHIDSLIDKEGQTTYARQEAEAAAILVATGDGSKDTALRQLSEEYPNAVVTANALRERARQRDTPLFVPRWLLGRARTEDERATALVGLARAYEQHKEWNAARDTWQHLARDAGARVVAAVDPDRPVREFVAEQMKRPEYRPSIGLPDLPVPLSRAWRVPLTAERLLASGPAGDPDFFFLARDGHVLIGRDTATGKQSFATDLGELLTWAVRRADLIVAGGPRSVWTLRLTDGNVLSQFTPPGDRLGPYTDFRLVAGRLFFLEGDGCLWALDVETGQVLWNHAAPGARLHSPERGSRFSPFFHTGQDHVVLQTTASQGRILDAVTGTLRHEFPAGPDAWAHPPLALDERRLVFAPNPRHIALLDLATGKEVWRRPVERDSSLTGDPPQFLGGGDVLLVLVARTFGFELQRLNPDTGNPLWAKPLLLREDNLNLAHAAFGAECVYLPTGDVLRAVLLADGRQLWDCPLAGGDGSWQVHVTRRCLVVHAQQAHTELDPAHAFRRYRAADVAGLFPTLTPLPIGAGFAAAVALGQQGQSPGQFPVLLCDAGDGRPIQRLNFATRGPWVGIAWRPTGGTVVGGDSAWGLR